MHLRLSLLGYEIAGLDFYGTDMVTEVYEPEEIEEDEEEEPVDLTFDGPYRTGGLYL